MSNERLRELERRWRNGGASDDQIALANGYQRAGKLALAAQTIMPLAFHPAAEETIRTLANDKGETYANAVDLLAARTFSKTDDLAVRLAYLSRRIAEEDVSSALCDLLVACAQENLHASLRICAENLFNFSIAPANGAPLMVNHNERFGATNVTLEGAAQACPSFALFRPIRDRLLGAGYAPTAAFDLARIDYPARTPEGHPAESRRYTMLLHREQKAIILGASNYRHYRHRTRTYSQSGATTPAREPGEITLLEPRGAR